MSVTKGIYTDAGNVAKTRFLTGTLYVPDP
ncbi:hypothetical protein EYZ11_010017 [Aspergillus tanneri]|uniref:Uncharacterized protein n=1 Tax=Aspergillus tanneri TaxID=1220188 RepID=A0A4V3UNB3_9EURO|nr:hypothetical protein EYZ11_010017 [Aspergillus tanneri]